MVHVDVEAISGICGSISIACWVVVFSPQIVENFRRSSAEGLSIIFIVVWLAGDVFNILGAVLQGVLPTMIILAVYYTLADIVLLLQCFYYRGFTLRDHAPSTDNRAVPNGAAPNEPTERSALLSSSGAGTNGSSTPTASSSSALAEGQTRRGSFRDQLNDQIQSLDATRLSPATPMHASRRDEAALKAQSPVQKQRPLWKAILFNLTAVLVVCAAGVLGWWLSARRRSTSSHHRHKGHPDEDGQRPELAFNVLGQVFGYVCAVLYLGSRLPQLLLNYRRKSTEGISMLFFLFACIGNLTYVLSIVAYEPQCEGTRHGRLAYGNEFCRHGEAGRLYARNFIVNLSWLLGSFGTLLLDAGVFVQFYLYRRLNTTGGESAVE